MPRAKKPVDDAPRQIGRDAGETTFTLKASVHDDSLFLRQGLADGTARVPKLGDVKAEVAFNIGNGSGAVLVTLSLGEGNKSRWRTYVFSPETLIRAAIDKLIAEPMPAKEEG